jgi:hypothetical protein
MILTQEQRRIKAAIIWDFRKMVRHYYNSGRRIPTRGERIIFGVDRDNKDYHLELDLKSGQFKYEGYPMPTFQELFGFDMEKVFIYPPKN